MLNMFIDAGPVSDPDQVNVDARFIGGELDRVGAEIRHDLVQSVAVGGHSEPRIHLAAQDDLHSPVDSIGRDVEDGLLQQDGEVQTALFSNYLIPTILDIPDRVQSIIIENADHEGPWGVRGMAEMPYIPLAPAVTAAVHDA